MKYTFFVITLLCAFTGNQIFAQSKIGLIYDAEKRPLQNTFDLFTYTAKNKVNVTVYLYEFEQGYYFTKDQKKVLGWINLNSKKLQFKSYKDGLYSVLKPDVVESFVLGADSFVTITNYMKSGKLRDQPSFSKFIDKVGAITYVQLLGYSGGIKYLAKHDSSQVWEEFIGGSVLSPEKGNLKEMCFKYFGNIPELKQEIDSNILSVKDLSGFIKVASYHYKLAHDLPIYVNQFWKLPQTKSKAKYYAKIESKKDSIWTLNFYDNDELRFQTKYKSLNPTTKLLTNSYYKNGVIRGQLSYEENDVRKYQLFNNSGNYIMQYQLSELEDEYTFKTEYVTKYDYLADEIGYLLANVHSDSIQSVINEIDGIKYYQTYKKQSLLESYKLVNDLKVYHAVESSYEIKLSSLEKKISKFKKKSYTDKLEKDSIKKEAINWDFDNAKLINAKGILMVTLQMDPTGKVMDYKILNSLQTDYNNYLKYFLENKVKNKFSFKPYKVNGEKVNFEITVPFNFRLVNFIYQSSQPYDPNMYGAPNSNYMPTSIPSGGY